MQGGQPAWHTMSMYLKVEMLIFSYAPELEIFMYFSKKNSFECCQSALPNQMKFKLQYLKQNVMTQAESGKLLSNFDYHLVFLTNLEPEYE